jgi:hypothetical protein
VCLYTQKVTDGKTMEKCNFRYFLVKIGTDCRGELHSPLQEEKVTRIKNSVNILHSLHFS